jgi:hypothetical protein
MCSITLNTVTVELLGARAYDSNLLEKYVLISCYMRLMGIMHLLNSGNPRI